MKLKDFNTLKKIMARTTSDNDAEALESIRAANRLLASESLTWQRVLDKTVSVRHEIEDVPRDFDFAGGVDINATFERALDKATGSFRDFLLSLQEQWEEKAWLSESQKDALFKAAER